jgi:hypothetical protein
VLEGPVIGPVRTGDRTGPEPVRTGLPVPVLCFALRFRFRFSIFQDFYEPV